MSRLAAIALLCALGCTSTVTRSPPSASASAAQSKSARLPATRTLFDFHVGFWVNLHQRLFAESERDPPADRLEPSDPAERATWNGALASYRRRYPERGFLTLIENEQLIAVNRRLAELETASDLGSAGLPAELRSTLESAAPVYRRERFAADEQAGRALAERLSALVARHGAPLASALSKAYATPWPEKPVRVDIAAYAGSVGAYTVIDPIHVMIASNDRRHAGDTALEILFHETSHGLMKRFEKSIDEACAAQHKRVSPMLWHVMLFYTTGELVRRELGSGYTPYAYRNGLYARKPDWQAAEPLLAHYLGDYLDGKIALDSAISQIVAGLPSEPEPS